jgi:type VI secretion system secreted protein Hcp
MAVDYFLKIDGISGDSQDRNFKDQIVLLSWSWGGEQKSAVHTGSTGSGAGKVEIHPLTVTKHYDKSSVSMFKSLTTGTHSANALLSAVKAGANGKPYLKIDLKSVFVSSYVVTAVDEFPVESITFTFSQVTVEYFSQDEKGTVTSTGKSGWNIVTNQAI